MIDDITLTQTEKEAYWNRFHEMGELIEHGDVFEKVARAFFTGFALACELRPTEPSLPRKMVKEINFLGGDGKELDHVDNL